MFVLMLCYVVQTQLHLIYLHLMMFGIGIDKLVTFCDKHSGIRDEVEPRLESFYSIRSDEAQILFMNQMCLD